MSAARKNQAQMFISSRAVKSSYMSLTKGAFFCTVYSSLPRPCVWLKHNRDIHFKYALLLELRSDYSQFRMSECRMLLDGPYKFADYSLHDYYCFNIVKVM